MLRVLPWLAVLTLCSGLGIQAACNNPIDGLRDEGEPLPEKRGSEIPYTALVFGDVITPKESDDGGWQAMCIHLAFKRHVDDVSEGRSSRVECSLRIDFPIILADGTWISGDKAQKAAASSLNEAISKLDMQRPTASVCRALWLETRKLAKKAVSGARVNQNCRARKGEVIPEVSWP